MCGLLSSLVIVAAPGVAIAHDGISFGFSVDAPSYYQAPQPYNYYQPPAVVYQQPVYPQARYYNYSQGYSAPSSYGYYHDDDDDHWRHEWLEHEEREHEEHEHEEHEHHHGDDDDD